MLKPTGGRRDLMGYGLAVLNRLGGSPIIDRLGLRKPTEKAVFEATRAGVRTALAAGRTFTRVRGRGSPVRPKSSRTRAVFDLTPDEEQIMIRDTVAEFAAERLRPAASAADAARTAPMELLNQANELGVSMIGIPEELGGACTERSTITSLLIAEALAHGDMGLAVACLAPSAVSTALVLWGDDSQQRTYLPAFVGESVPAAALAIAEPRALFDPFSPSTTARRVPGGFVLDGVKTMVPSADRAELLVIAAALEGSGPALFLVETSATSGLTVEAEPGMGLRAAGMCRVVLSGVSVPDRALLASGAAYRDCVRLSRLAWSALALGTAKAVLDHTTGYVNERTAFGEPISHRQGVAFKIADMATELEGMRLVTLRAASRCEQGLDFAGQVALARQLTGEYGMRIGSDGVQLLGGHGFVKDHPVERWFRDLRAVAVMEGVVLL